MSNVRIAWTLPTTRVLGEALPPAQIEFVELQMSADGGGNFGGLAQVPPDTLEHVVQDLDPGTYIFRGIVQDTAGRRSDSVEATAGILSNPSALPDFTVTIE